MLLTFEYQEGGGVFPPPFENRLQSLCGAGRLFALKVTFLWKILLKLLFQIWPMVIFFTLDWVLVPFNSNFLEYFNFLKGGGVFPPPPGSQRWKKTLVLKGLIWLKDKKFTSLIWFVQIIFRLQKVGVAAVFSIVEKGDPQVKIPKYVREGFWQFLS